MSPGCETGEPTLDLLSACRQLKAAGYSLALDDFVWQPKFDPLLDLVDYVKVDFTLTGVQERARLFERLSSRALALHFRPGRWFTHWSGFWGCRSGLHLSVIL